MGDMPSGGKSLSDAAKHTDRGGKKNKLPVRSIRRRGGAVLWEKQETECGSFKEKTPNHFWRRTRVGSSSKEGGNLRDLQEGRYGYVPADYIVTMATPPPRIKKRRIRRIYWEMTWQRTNDRL